MTRDERNLAFEFLSEAKYGFVALRQWDEIWSRAVQSGAAKFNPDLCRLTSELYGAWIRKVGPVLGRLREMPRDEQPDWLDDWEREYFHLAKTITAFSAEQLIEGMRQGAAGETVSLDEALRELGIADDDGMPADSRE